MAIKYEQALARYQALVSSAVLPMYHVPAELLPVACSLLVVDDDDYGQLLIIMDDGKE